MLSIFIWNPNLKQFLNLKVAFKDVSDSESLDRYVRGLSSKIRYEVSIREPASLSETMKLSEKVSIVERETFDFRNYNNNNSRRNQFKKDNQNFTNLNDNYVHIVF